MGFEGGRDLQPVFTRTGPVKANKARKRVEIRIRISGLMIHRVLRQKVVPTKMCVAEHSDGLETFGL